MDNIKLYKNIKNRRQELGLSQEDLAKKVGYKDRTSIAKIEAGKVDLSQSKIIDFANVLNISPSELMGWEKYIEAYNLFQKPIIKSDTYTDKEKEIIEKYRNVDDDVKFTVNIILDMAVTLENYNSKTYCSYGEDAVYYREIPCYPKLASAGTGEYLFDDLPTNMIKIDNRRYPNADYAIQVNGDSMEPTYYEGDTLIVERNSIPEIGKTGIFIVDGMGYVKRMGKGELISDNEAYENIKGYDGVCMGRVLGRM